MLTGRHMVRDVSCKNCNSKLGWIYEFATEDSQRYKEGRVILERALVRESEGFEEHVPSDNSWAPTYRTNNLLFPHLHHPTTALRTSFSRLCGQWRSSFADPAPWPLTSADWLNGRVLAKQAPPKHLRQRARRSKTTRDWGIKPPVRPHRFLTIAAWDTRDISHWSSIACFYSQSSACSLCTQLALHCC